MPNDLLPLVSIVIPSLNQGAYIESTLRSVLTQDYPNLEILVMDSASTDNTAQVVSRYLQTHSDRLRFVSEPDRGQAHAINKGVAQTSGEIIGWLNSDDIYEPGSILAAVQYFQQNPEVDLVYGDANFVGVDDRVIARCAHVEPYDWNRLVHYTDFIVQPAAFFTRRAFNAVGGGDESLKYTMDYDLFLKIASRFKVAYLPRLMANFKWWGQNKSATGGWKRLAEIERITAAFGAGDCRPIRESRQPSSIFAGADGNAAGENRAGTVASYSRHHTCFGLRARFEKPIISKVLARHVDRTGAALALPHEFTAAEPRHILGGLISVQEAGDRSMNRRLLLKYAGMTALGAFTGFGCRNDMAAETTKDLDMNKTVKVKVFDSKGNLVGPIEMPKVIKTDAEWKAQLTADQYKIARNKGTERAFCGNLFDNHKLGVYACVCCDLPLFSSNSKFESGTGWPSFFQPVASENVYKHVDADGYREEILCTRCDCHLGHVFDDGPVPTGLRFCVNSASLVFVDSDKVSTLADPAVK